MDNNRLMRALMIGAVLAVGAVGLFLFIYLVVLAGSDNATRLFASLCIPPLVLALLFGGYFFFIHGKE
jgi:hypothetical protein